MAQGVELRLEGFYIQQVFVQQVVVDKSADISQRAKSQALDDFGREGIFQLAKTI